jgi:hypothetical protein
MWDRLSLNAKDYQDFVDHHGLVVLDAFNPAVFRS